MSRSADAQRGLGASREVRGAAEVVGAQNEKEKAYNTRGSNVVPHRSTNRA